MKQLTNIQRATQYLNKIFKAINEEYFNNELPTPTITIQSTVRCYGHISVDKIWKTEDGRETYEMNIAAEYLTRPIENVVTTLLHETAHLYNLENGIKDMSNPYYHNKRFKKTAEEMCHIVIDYDKRIGYSPSSPSEETLDFIIRNGFEDIQIYRDTPFATMGISGTAGTRGTDPTATPKRKNNSIKWICPKCGNIARTTSIFRIGCFDCMEEMVQA